MHLPNKLLDEEILVRENSVEVIREREDWDDLWRGQTVPGDLVG